MFLALIFLVIFGALYYHAANTAESAAREGASYLRLAGTTTERDAYLRAAEGLSEAYAREVGRLAGAEAEGSFEPTNGRVVMKVTGTVDLPIIGSITVEKSARATLEQWVADE